MGVPPRLRSPLVFILAILVMVVAGIVAGAVALHNVAGPNSASGIPTPVPLETPTPTPVQTPAPTLAPTACQSAHFGSPLQPSGAPADIHVYSAAPAMQIDTSKLYQARITTPKGAVVLCLEPRIAPKTVNNFVVLARNHYYDGLKFHRVVPGFVIQGGDPKGDGTGGPGYTFADEPVQGKYTLGTLAMANSGTNTNGSQFFVCIGDQCLSLPPKYNLFGHLVSGLDVALNIQQGDVMTSVTVAEQS